MRNNLQFTRPFNSLTLGSDGDLNTTGNVSFPSELDGAPVYKNFRNLIVNAGHIVTTTNRCKGLIINVFGNCVVNGTISMTDRGCVAVGTQFEPNDIKSLYGQDLSLLNLGISAIGGNGGASVGQYISGANNSGVSGKAGEAGVNGACGGGGSGGANGSYGGTAYSGAGSAGTSFSGGAGGGGCSVDGSNITAYSGAANGGAGGGGRAARDAGSSGGRYAGGGAGNPGGAYSMSGATSGATSGNSGTGGLLILIVYGNLTINGLISSNGCNGGYGYGCGGSSGGGSVTVAYKGSYINNGSIQANGGAYGNGGAGGAGSLRVNRILN